MAASGACECSLAVSRRRGCRGASPTTEPGPRRGQPLPLGWRATAPHPGAGRGLWAEGQGRAEPACPLPLCGRPLLLARRPRRTISRAPCADPSAPPAFRRPQLDAALEAAFHRLDAAVRASMPDGTTVGAVLLKRAPNGAPVAHSRSLALPPLAPAPALGPTPTPPHLRSPPRIFRPTPRQAPPG